LARNDGKANDKSQQSIMIVFGDGRRNA
jgi:hypothetical protein